MTITHPRNETMDKIRPVKTILSLMLSTLCLSMVLAGAAPAQEQHLPGIYFISHGVNPNNGPEYTGKVAIQYRADNVYSAQWKVSDSGGYQGIGFLIGDTFYVGWSYDPGYTVTVYKVDGGRLYGRFISDGTVAEPGLEELEGPPGLHGRYEIVKAYGSDDGFEYSGTVGIRKTDETYQVTWWIGNAEYKGVGLLKGDYFVVTSGTSVGVSYYDIKGDELFGRWALSDVRIPGVENLIRKKKGQKDPDI